MPRPGIRVPKNQNSLLWGSAVVLKEGDAASRWMGRGVLHFSLMVLVLLAPCVAQNAPSPEPSKNSTANRNEGGAVAQGPQLPDAPEAQQKGQQSKRILGVIPNYRAVSADANLPPLSGKEKFHLATEDSFDYSSFLVAGVMAGMAQAKNSTPEFHQGAAGFGRYYWHSFADQAVGNYFTEFLIPSLTHEDPRYYTRYHGNFFTRTGYAVSRLFVTRTDSGGETFNLSEIVGNGAGAGLSDLYYPSAERTWTKTGQKWANQLALDGVFNILKEFWPNIRHGVFRK